MVMPVGLTPRVGNAVVFDTLITMLFVPVLIAHLDGFTGRS
jgi:hypothetical protein